MIEYLKQFNSLPQDIKEKMSSATKTQLIDSLEKKYGIDLASFVMRVVIRNIAYNKQTATLVREFGISKDKASQIVRDLKTKIFAEIATYLQSEKDLKFLPKNDIKKLAPPMGIDHLIAAHNDKIAKNDIVKVPEQSTEEKADDDKELSEFSKIVNEIRKDLPIDDLLKVTIEQIIKEVKLSFSSETLDKRFRQSLSFYLKGSKSRINTREFFLKDIAKGGLNFEPILADRVLKIADTKIRKPINTGKVNIKSSPDGTTFIFNDQELKKEKLKEISANNTDYDLARAIQERKLAKEKSPVQEDALPEPGQPKQVDVKNTFTKNSVLDSGTKKDEASTPQKKKRMSVSSKSVMHDIKPVSQAMSPIDELRYMDLTTFKRMGPNTNQRVSKIIEKIDLISKDGLGKRLESINAWKDSPINNIYLQIGKQSISQGLSVEEVIAQRKIEGKDILETDEFEAILDLNNSLRF